MAPCGSVWLCLPRLPAKPFCHYLEASLSCKHCKGSSCSRECAPSPFWSLQPVSSSGAPLGQSIWGFEKPPGTPLPPPSHHKLLTLCSQGICVPEIQRSSPRPILLKTRLSYEYTIQVTDSFCPPARVFVFPLVCVRAPRRVQGLTLHCLHLPPTTTRGIIPRGRPNLLPSHMNVQEFQISTETTLSCAELQKQIITENGISLTHLRRGAGRRGASISVLKGLHFDLKRPESFFHEKQKSFDTCRAPLALW